MFENRTFWKSDLGKVVTGVTILKTVKVVRKEKEKDERSSIASAEKRKKKTTPLSKDASYNLDVTVLES